MARFESGYSFLARGVCIAAPRRGRLSFWLHAHSPRGHGIHSTLLYTLCREVFFLLYRRWLHSRISYQERTEGLLAALTMWNEVHSSRAASLFDTLQLVTTAQELSELSASIIGGNIPRRRIIVVCAPRRSDFFLEKWTEIYTQLSAGVAIDLYAWGLLLFVDGVARHKFGIRGFLYKEV